MCTLSGSFIVLCSYRGINKTDGESEIVLATIVLGLTTKGPRSDNSSTTGFPLKANPPPPRQKNVSNVGILKVATFLLVYIFEFAVLIALLVIGGKNTYRGDINKDCGDGSLGGGIPWSRFMLSCFISRLVVAEKGKLGLTSALFRL